MHPSDKHLLKVLYRYSGIETICNKARVTEEQQPKKILPTLPLWLIGIYVATYGVASQRYENRVDIIENKVNTIYPQLTSPEPKTKEMAFRRIEIIQNMMAYDEEDRYSNCQDVLESLIELESSF